MDRGGVDYPRTDRSRALPQPLSIVDDGKEFLRLTTLAAVRDFLKHIPKDRRQFDTWQHVAAELDKAAAGGDTAQVLIALQMVLMLEKEYRLGNSRAADKLTRTTGGPDGKPRAKGKPRRQRAGD